MEAMVVFADGGNGRIYFESTGSGTPVLLVMGLGMTAAAWSRTVPLLSQSLQVLVFDNPGAGRSDVPPGPYTVAEMALDAVAVLDAAGLERAHVYGISLGGMVAQQLALNHPRRLLSLVLGASAPGGSRSEAPDAATLEFLERRAAMPAEEGAWASVPYLYAARTRRRHGGRIGEDIARRLRFPITADGYRAQLAAALSHDAADRLGAIEAPTLVLHGAEDRMIPPQNGRLIAELIPRAELQICDDAGHMYTTDEPRADAEVLRFLLSSTGAGQRRSRQPRTARGARA